MHLNLRPKIMAGFTVILLLMGALVFIGERYAGRHLETAIGNASVLLAEERARKLDTVFALIQESMVMYSRRQTVRSAIETSNARFAAMAEARALILRVDREWKEAYPGAKTAAMEEIAESGFSRDLKRDFVDFTYERYGYRKYAEIIVTDRYGAVVGASGITSDYYQGDEEWWLRAMEEGEAAVGPEFDESSGTHAISFVNRIDNANGEPIGVMKGVVDIKGTIRENLILGRRFQSTEFKVLTPSAGLVYATRLFTYDEDVSAEDYFAGAAGDSGFFRGQERNRKMLFAYARSKGMRGHRGIEWIVVVSHDEKEILALALKLGRVLRGAAAACILLGFMISFYVANAVYGPVKQLQTGAEAIGAGRLDYRVIVRSQDEIGRLATSFNVMAGRLARVEAELRYERAGLEKTIIERTERLRQVNEDLHREAAVREKVEEALLATNEQLAGFMDAATDSYFIFNSSLKLVDVNGAGEKLLGRAKRELVGQSFSELYPKTGREGIITECRQVVKTGTPAFFEDVISSGTDTRHLHFSAFQVGGGLGLIASDFTRLKEYEEELRLNIAELKRSNRDLEQFAYVASHDLQEPLRIVTSYVRLLEEHFGGSLDEKPRQYFGFIVESSQRMRNLIRDLLAYSKVDTKAWKLEAVDSGKIVQRAVDNLKVAVEESGAEITWEGLPPVLADEVQAVQVFQNIISNSIKFHSADPPRIGIEGNVGQRDVIFCVSDNGIGIAREFHDRIFDIFRRLNESEKYEGTGIGLALAKKIVERHGGSVRVESEVGRGTKVYFTLPYAGEVDERA